MKYFLIAGEASGDLHASNLMKGLKAEDPAVEFRFLGGDLMEAVAEGQPLQHFREMNFMGISAVIRNMGHLKRILAKTKRAIREFSPDAVILVDYAGFNLRMARFASGLGIKTFYYISPKVWAWRKGRIRLLKKYVHKLFVIFPFEVEFFHNHGMEVEYHGNPLMDVLAEFNSRKPARESWIHSASLDDRPVIALLAGSRKQEIKSCLPEMIRAASGFPDYQFVVAGAPSVENPVYDSLLEGSGIKIVYNDTYNLLSHAEAAIVTSGTATLETALFDIPQVVVYKTGFLTYRIGKLFVTFRFFSLVNLIFGDELVPELLQVNLESGIREELKKILNTEKTSLQMREGYAKIREMLGEAGVSRRVAGKMVELLR
ncbi:MAG: lipid-A-disaccharide synthase [Bacteroidales bacterium]